MWSPFHNLGLQESTSQDLIHQTVSTTIKHNNWAKLPEINLYFRIWNNLTINPIQDGGEDKKALPTSFSSVTSTNLELSPQNFVGCRMCDRF